MAGRDDHPSIDHSLRRKEVHEVHHEFLAGVADHHLVGIDAGEHAIGHFDRQLSLFLGNFGLGLVGHAGTSAGRVPGASGTRKGGFRQPAGRGHDCV